MESSFSPETGNKKPDQQPSYQQRINKAVDTMRHYSSSLPNAADVLEAVSILLRGKGTRPVIQDANLSAAGEAWDSFSTQVQRQANKRLSKQEALLQKKEREKLAHKAKEYRRKFCSWVRDTHYVDYDWNKALVMVDKEFFREDSESSEIDPSGYAVVGWRESDVAFGNYLAPDHRSIPDLLSCLGNKVNELKGLVSVQDWNKFVGWATWVLIAIHPKFDGNGRLGKAMAQYMCAQKAVMEWKDELWVNAFRTANEEIKQRVSEATGQEIPDFSRFPDTREDSKQKYDSMINFYRYHNQDHVAGFLKRAIGNTTIIEGRFYPAGLTDKAFSLFELFIEKAPDYPC